jgi:hypothetical protein
MKLIFTFFVIFTAFTVFSISQTQRPYNFQERNKSDKPRLVAEFLQQELSVIPGEQLYKAQDLWEQSGAKKIKIDAPIGSAKSKDFIKNITIEDAGTVVEGFKKVVYNGKNETIIGITITTTLDKGDFFLEKFVDLNGQYEPINSTSKSIVSQGNYFFDDYIIKATEYTNDTIDLNITKNPQFNLNRNR